MAQWHSQWISTHLSRPMQSLSISRPTQKENLPTSQGKLLRQAPRNKMSSSSSNSDSSTAEDSDIGEKEEGYLHEHISICKSVTLIAGKSKAARVHMLSAEETSITGILLTWCGKKLNGHTAQIATGDKFTIESQQSCRMCQKSWPDTITSLFHNIEPEAPENPDQKPDNFKTIHGGLWW